MYASRCRIELAKLLMMSCYYYSCYAHCRNSLIQSHGSRVLCAPRRRPPPPPDTYLTAVSKFLRTIIVVCTAVCRIATSAGLYLRGRRKGVFRAVVHPALQEQPNRASFAAQRTHAFFPHACGSFIMYEDFFLVFKNRQREKSPEVTLCMAWCHQRL